VFIIYDEVVTTAEEILLDHTSMHPSMKYNMEIEHDDYISFLDLNLHRLSNEIITGIYRKPTYTYLVIPALSNHTVHHKMAAFKCVQDRVNNLPIVKEEKLRGKI
jgi:hypothetical protein